MSEERKRRMGSGSNGPVVANHELGSTPQAKENQPRKRQGRLVIKDQSATTREASLNATAKPPSGKTRSRSTRE